MKNSVPLFSSTRLIARYICVFGVVIAMATAIFYIVPNQHRLLMVGLTGAHHMGQNFNISTFYVNGYSGGNVGREGGGGSNVCCMTLPEKWRPGLVAELRWSVSDWSKEDSKQTDAGNYESVTWQCFKAVVPVEKYEGAPAQLYVHFFAAGKARIVASSVGPDGPAHPIQRSDPHSSDKATTGIPIPSIFTQAEIDGDAKTMSIKQRIGDSDER